MYAVVLENLYLFVIYFINANDVISIIAILFLAIEIEEGRI